MTSLTRGPLTIIVVVVVVVFVGASLMCCLFIFFFLESWISLYDTQTHALSLRYSLQWGMWDVFVVVKLTCHFLSSGWDLQTSPLYHWHQTHCNWSISIGDRTYCNSTSLLSDFHQQLSAGRIDSCSLGRLLKLNILIYTLELRCLLNGCMNFIDSLFCV